MKDVTPNLRSSRMSAGVICVAAFSLMVALPIQAQGSDELTGNLRLSSSLRSPAEGQPPGNAAGPSHQNSIPAGTILPVVLRTSLSFEKCQPGQMVRGKIAQDVPLENGSTIRKGSTIEGHVVEVTPASSGTEAKVSIQFDKLNLAGQWVTVKTNLRAIAGFMTVLEAGVPEEAPGEGSVSNWLPTTQIGGDSVYGVKGPVMSANDTSKVIGRSTGDGVLVTASAKEGTECRGAVEGNDKPQALWVFSSDACGTYGIEHLKIIHAGRTSPEGTIVLASEKPNLSLRSGDGLLLRVGR
jgi:hypothetical protein